jgi:hypothetical protein
MRVVSGLFRYIQEINHIPLNLVNVNDTIWGTMLIVSMRKESKRDLSFYTYYGGRKAIPKSRK